MQWLSHSQKRYCELCMTPYRFTKFYNPNMPTSLPLSVFVEKSARYALANSLSWIRAAIAISFWLLILPYLMRRGWSYMFWLSRESWASNTTGFASAFSDSIQLSSTMLGRDTCPASPLFAPTTTPAKSFAEMVGAPGASSFIEAFWESLYWVTGLKDGQPRNARSDSLLGDVKLFKTLTNNAVFNEGLIAVMEGQIITVVVVVSFILIILVRDYVVQQQPELNIREGAEREQQAAQQPPVAVQPAHVPHANDSDDSEDDEELAQVNDEPARAVAEEAQEDWASEVVDNTPDTSSTGSGDAYTPSADSREDRSISGDAATTGHHTEETHRKRDPALSLLEPEAGPSRQRSVSEGAQIQASVNPLANNTWSFASGPAVEPESSHSHASTHPDSEAENETSPDANGNTLARSHETVTTAGSSANGHVVQDGQRPIQESPVPPAVTAETDSEQQDDHPPQNAAGRITGFMYGDIEGRYQEMVAQPQLVPDDGEHAVDWEDVPIDGEDELLGPVPGQAHDEEAENAAFAAAEGLEPANEGDDAGLDAEAIEDMEDFEGIMDLLGMRGPITNLFQNVIFCAVLVQAALTTCVFIPFNVGRVFFWFVDRPERLLRILYELSKVAQDFTFIFFGAASWIITNLVDMVTERIGGAVAAQVVYARKGSWELAWASGKRVGHFLELFLTDIFATGTGMQQWSATSHGALMNIKTRIVLFFALFGEALSGNLGDVRQTLGALISSPYRLYQHSMADTTSSVDLGLAYWSSADITLAVLAGYLFVLMAAAMYVKSGIRITRGSAIEEWETGLVDTLHQASGIFKVITIISIEMLAFPLYCGLLLDCALMPLFSGASITSRLLFTRNNPWTSVFVHWFVGTGYMFHFALFVSMCRKIMRPGVLCMFLQLRTRLYLTIIDFIRDPDDPDFHPVRDVLDRNLATQLRKIMFSAFVYGALVIICLGGVVWGLAFVAPGVLPIHYSSNEPILEFPLDLLFYNFLMPFSLKLLRPDTNLLVMFKWCFRKSACMLRLTYFLFGQRRLAEEGTLQAPQKYSKGSLGGWLFLDLNRKQDTVKRMSWKNFFDGIDSERGYTPPKRGRRRKEAKRLSENKAKLVGEDALVPDGRFVRAPATDRIKIPKGTKVFLNVNADGERQDGKSDDDLYSTLHFKMVYIPPNFLRRIFLFILLIWTFAAIIGVGVTIIPLIVGRLLFKLALPAHVRTNDIYAFCIGFHILGFGLYLLDSAWKSWSEFKLTEWATEKLKSVRTATGLVSAAKVLYAYTFMLLVCPLMIAVLVELYINLPLHSIVHPPGKSDATPGKSEHHVRIIELWTMGLLYMRLLIKMSHSFMHNTRFELAREAILSQGWHNPDIKVLTKAFVLPGLLLSTAAILAPPGIVAGLEMYGFFPAAIANKPELVAERILRYRHSYPVVAFFTISARYGTLLRNSLDSLKAQVRDDTYLMGERLQNYDGSPPHASSMPQRAAAD